MNTLLTTLSRLATGKFYVFMPMRSRYRSKKIVKCPESGQRAEILVDTTASPSTKAKKKSFSIRNCSLWPKKKGCTESCEK